MFSVDLSTIGSGIILSNDNKTITSNQSQGSGCPWRSVYLSPIISLNAQKLSEYIILSQSDQFCGR